MRSASASKKLSRPGNMDHSGAGGAGYREAARHRKGGTDAARRNCPAARAVMLAASADAEPDPATMKMLSARAQNVLKELTFELTGEQPPKGQWAPSRELLLALTAERLAAARNCGPQTAREIILWAQGRCVTIKPPMKASRSLSQMWAGLVADASVGALTSAQVIAALQRSIRRRSTRIPVPFQIVLLEILTSFQ
jgi:hypothetical protein